MRKLSIVLAWLIGIAIFGTMAFGYHRIAWLSADASTSDAAVWVFDPHAGPGDDLHMEVQARGGIRLGLEQIRVRGPGVEVHAQGRGNHWGYSFTSKSSDSGSDSVDLVVRVPPEHPVGTELALTLDVQWVKAQSGSSSFSNTSGSAEILLALPIRSSGERAGVRLLTLLQALLCFAALVWLYFRAGPALGQADRPDASEAETEGYAYLLLAVAAVVCALGYPIFARPMTAALGAHGVLTVVYMLVWVIGAPVVAWRIHKRRGQAAFAELRALDAGTPIAALRPKLELITGARVRVRGRTITVKRARKDWVQLKFTSRQAQTAEVRYNATSPTLCEVICAVADATGELEFSGSYATVTIKRGADRKAIQADWDEQTMVAMKAMMERVNEMMERLQAMRRPDQV